MDNINTSTTNNDQSLLNESCMNTLPLKSGFGVTENHSIDNTTHRSPRNNDVH